jgi:TetR/AcrR family transcriptional repressor of nem operon
MARPRQFEESQVLAAAAELFRHKGYEAVSTRELGDRTGLTTASLYNAFGDKRGLYRRALEHYVDGSLRERIARLEAGLSPRAAIAAFFDEMIKRSLADPLHCGCLLVNSALEAGVDDVELRTFVADETRLIEDFFQRCAAAGQRSGEITREQSAEDQARCLLAMLLGLRVLARIRPDRELFEGLVRPVLASLEPAPSSDPTRKPHVCTRTPRP